MQVRELDAAIELASSYAERLLRRSAVHPVPSLAEMDGRPVTPWATADGMLLLHLSSPESYSADRLAMSSYLYEEQDDDAGGWKTRDEVCADATSMVLIALATCGQVQIDHIGRGIDFLKRCMHGGGGVRCTPDVSEIPRVFPTAMAIWAFSAVRAVVPLSLRDDLSVLIVRAAGWLNACVCLDEKSDASGWNPEGDPSRRPTIAHTGMGLFAMRLAHAHGVPSASAAARTTIEQGQPLESQHSLELRTIVSSGHELRTMHPNLAWSVIGLASSSPITERDEPMRHTVDALLASQTRTGPNAGAFPWSSAGNEEYSIWSTFRSVHAISLARTAHENHHLSHIVSAHENPEDNALPTVGPERRKIATLTMIYSGMLVPIAGYLITRSSLLEDVDWLATTTVSSAETLWREQGGPGPTLWAVVCYAVPALAVFVYRALKRRREPRAGV
ncbi:MAG: hypothetical protein ITG02_16355 [Patulibacter sp.]|nr:hypothetical protein [Patulibacter sp.]